MSVVHQVITSVTLSVLKAEALQDRHGIDEQDNFTHRALIVQVAGIGVVPYMLEYTR